MCGCQILLMHGTFKYDRLWNVLQTQNNWKGEDMGCVESKQEARPSLNRSFRTHKQKMCDNGNTQTVKFQQDLSISDYEAFLQKSKQDANTDYPSAFNFIKIAPMPNIKLAMLAKQDVPALNCTREQLAGISVQIFMQNSFARTVLAEDTVKELVSSIAKGYNSVSYHNFTHGFALMQMLYKCFKKDNKLAAIYTAEEQAYYMMAGLAHDLNHKGTNNSLQVKLNSQLAKLAENDAVLERMHARTFFEICKSKPKLDVLSKSTNLAVAKEKITRVILATDMARHFKNLDKLSKARAGSNGLNFEDEETKIVLMENLIHACDIGNSLLPSEEYMNWGALLTYEFNEQAKIEASKNVAVTEFLKDKGLIGFYNDQIQFLGTFVIPLWKEISSSFVGIAHMIQNSERNIAMIKQLKQKQEK